MVWSVGRVGGSGRDGAGSGPALALSCPWILYVRLAPALTLCTLPPPRIPPFLPSQIELLAFLRRAAKGPVQLVEVLVATLTVTFDMNQPSASPMSTANWNRAAGTMFDIMVRPQQQGFGGLGGWGCLKA